MKTPDARYLAPAIVGGAAVFLTGDSVLARRTDVGVEVVLFTPRIALPAILLSRRAEASGDWVLARRFAEEALRREPTNVEARALMSQLAKAVGK